MKMKHRDPNHSTPESLAAADEWRAALAEVNAIVTRMQYDGYTSVTAEEHTQANARMEAAEKNLKIPERLLRFRAEDWPGRDPEHQFSIDILRRTEQHRQAQDQWANAHGIDRVQFEALVAVKTTQQKESKSRARTRRTSK